MLNLFRLKNKDVTDSAEAPSANFSLTEFEYYVFEITFGLLLKYCVDTIKTFYFKNGAYLQ